MVKDIQESVAKWEAVMRHCPRCGDLLFEVPDDEKIPDIEAQGTPIGFRCSNEDCPHYWESISFTKKDTL